MPCLAIGCAVLAVCLALAATGILLLGGLGGRGGVDDADHDEAIALVDQYLEALAVWDVDTALDLAVPEDGYRSDSMGTALIRSLDAETVSGRILEHRIDSVRESDGHGTLTVRVGLLFDDGHQSTEYIDLTQSAQGEWELAPVSYGTFRVPDLHPGLALTVNGTQIDADTLADFEDYELLLPGVFVVTATALDGVITTGEIEHDVSTVRYGTSLWIWDWQVSDSGRESVTEALTEKLADCRTDPDRSCGPMAAPGDGSWSDVDLPELDLEAAPTGPQVNVSTLGRATATFTPATGAPREYEFALDCTAMVLDGGGVDIDCDR